MKRKLLDIYNKLHKEFGPMHWWPADSAFEVIIGAILTQNTSWKNVEKAIANLKKTGALTPSAMAGLKKKKLAALIKPAGYYNIKAERIRNFLDFWRKICLEYLRIFVSNSCCANFINVLLHILK